MTTFYAHTNQTVDRSRWQTLEEHLRNVADDASARRVKNRATNVDDSIDDRDVPPFDSAFYLDVAGRLHDLGKAAPEFQRYLQEAALDQANGDEERSRRRCEINHSEAGAAWAKENFGPFVGTALAYLIAGHHAGLPDGTGGPAALETRLKQGKVNLENIRAAVAPLVADLQKIVAEFQKNPRIALPGFSINADNFHFWIRFLFSKLVDADRLDAEAFREPEKAAARGNFASIRELKEKFDRHMKERFGENETNDRAKSSGQNPNDYDSSTRDSVDVLRRYRAEVLAACRRQGRENVDKRLLTLTVPTGGGKTLAGMAFALERAVADGCERVVYAIPYTSIIDQTAKTFREIFGAENVVEHHCNFDVEKTLKRDASTQKTGKKPLNDAAQPDDANEFDDDFAAEFRQKMELAAEDWNAPIILTTNAQFFESLFAAKPSRCRKLWRIAKSVAILDEAQTLKPELTSPCVDALNQLTTTFGTTVVLCTATQPVLTNLDELCDSGNRRKPAKLNETTPIVDAPERLYRDLNRVRYHFDDPNEPKSWEEIADELEEYDDVLCVVNTRRDCFDLYQILSEREKRRRETFEEQNGEPLKTPRETIALSALMCGAHRSAVIDEIKRRLAENAADSTTKSAPERSKRPLRVVSTQLVEAGVDLDFPVVFRALAGFDSIAQAAGRCNREGKLGFEGGKVRVFTPPKQAPPGLLRKGEAAAKELLRALRADLSNPSSFSRYFELFYSSLTSVDEKEILNRLKKNAATGDVPFRSVGEDFKLIDDDYSAPVYVLYGESPELLKRLRFGGIGRDIMRKLQRYCVNVPKPTVWEFKNTGRIEEIFPGVYAQTVPTDYDAVFGLDVFGDEIFSRLLNS